MLFFFIFLLRKLRSERVSGTRTRLISIPGYIIAFAARRGTVEPFPRPRVTAFRVYTIMSLCARSSRTQTTTCSPSRPFGRRPISLCFIFLFFFFLRLRTSKSNVGFDGRYYIYSVYVRAHENDASAKTRRSVRSVYVLKKRRRRKKTRFSFCPDS